MKMALSRCPGAGIITLTAKGHLKRGLISRIRLVKLILKVVNYNGKKKNKRIRY
jgi:hypothetical protein